ncbi:MAG TPA: sulfatase [Thermoanaerobaculia bacterium]|nr:sulfatase [Thermoanaerobaculia bacterium]
MVLALTAAALALIAALALWASRSGSEPAAAEEAAAASRRLDLSGAAAGRNVLLVTVDTLRADRLNSYGYTVRTTSPQLDALLGRGVLFEQAGAPRALTWPSLASVLTGLYPSGHGVTENGYEFPDEVEVLSERLAAAGYRTGAFLSNMCKANHQGWQAFACSGGEDGKTIRRALEWVGSLDGGEPWFLWVHLFGAHGPYYNGGDLAARELDPGYEGPIGGKKWQLDRVMEEQIPLTARDVQHLDALYDAAVIGTDGLAARLVEGIAVGPSGLDETLVVFLADHGEELYDHNEYLYHACSVYETTLHVPLGFVAPGLIPGGGRVPQTVELIDVAPTVLDLLGLPPAAESHGVSLVPYLERPGAGGGTGRPQFTEYGETGIRTVRAGTWKLIANPENHQPYCIPGAPAGHYPLQPVELYDLAADPGEQHDLAADHPVRVRELTGLADRRFSGLRRRAETQEVDAELRKELEALGYVQ